MATLITPDNPSALAIMQGLQKCPGIKYSYHFDLVDISGTRLDTFDVVDDSANAPTVSRDCTVTTPGTVDFSVDEALTWGADLVAPYAEISADQFAGGAVFEFPLGAYIATSPSKDPDTGLYRVTGYDKVYLLRSEVGDSFAAESSTTYADNVATLLDMAGIPGAKLAGHLNPAVVDFPASWAAKTIPAGKDMIFTQDDSNNYTFIDIVNALLAASGCRSIYTSPLGRFVVALVTKPAGQSLQWSFTRSDDVVKGSASYESDLWGVPNQFVFVQNGLTFAPSHDDGTDGRYVINNDVADAKHYRPPSDQATIGRVIRTTTHLDASGQSDLITQSEKIYTDTLSEAETVSLSTAPWPIAWHLDVLGYFDPTFDRAPGRKLQAKTWGMPLNGGDMTWTAYVVGDLS